MNKGVCQHDAEWVQGMYANSPWVCIKCGASITSGEMILWTKLSEKIDLLVTIMKREKNVAKHPRR